MNRAAYARARAAAARVIAEVAGGRKAFDVALADARARLNAGDCAMLQELAYGTLRWYHQLDGLLPRLLPRPLPVKETALRALLLCGLYQLRHMRLAPAVAVDATVEAAAVLRRSWAKGLINACLRAALRAREALNQALAQSPQLRASHPQWLLDRLVAAYPAHWERIAAANNDRPPMSARVNAHRITRADYLARLRAERSDASHAHARVDSAIVIEPPVDVADLPGFTDGLVSVQDAAAQLAALLLDAQRGERVLDACAAPGGKTGHVLERTPDLAELVALDIDARRLQLVAENLARLRLEARLIVGDAGAPAQWWDGHAFDRILLDAPCSSTGVIRRHPDIKLRRRPEELAEYCAAQARLLFALWPLLRTGGKLLYATCSLLPEENEAQMKSFMQAHPDARLEPLDGILPAPDATPAIGLQILPGEHGMDGFYYARIRKR